MLKSLSTYKILISNIALALLVFGVMVFVSYNQAKQANITAARVANTLEVLFHKEKLASATTDNETSSRAYLLTEEPQFLATFELSKTVISRETQKLKQLTAGSPLQQSSIDTLSDYLDKRIRLTDSVLALNTNAGLVKLLITGNGKAYMDQIRRLLNELHTEENILYEQRINENLRAIERQNKVFILIVSMILVVLVFFSWQEKRRVQSEEYNRLDAVSKNENRFRALVENNESIIALMNENLETIYRSPASERITGWSSEERKTVGTSALSHPDDAAQVENVMKQVMENPGIAIPILLRTKHKNGHWIWLEGMFRNMFHDPTVKGIIVNLNDVTERKQTEDQIADLNAELEQKVILRTGQLQSANNDMEAFTYSVSHDLRAPLRIINGFTVILEEDYTSKLDDEAKRLTAVIKKNTAKMGALIDGLLDFSRLRLQEISKTLIDMNEMIAEVIRSLETDRTRNIKWSISQLPSVLGDMNAIMQVWVNLVSNAIKYSGNNSNPQIEIGSFNNDDQVVFFVKDNGVGFDAAYSGKLFKVFQRLHSAEEFEGTGIGLAVVHKVVTKHGGKVWAGGEPGKGACFYFSLPVNPINPDTYES